MSNKTEIRFYAEELLNNPAFTETIQRIKQETIRGLTGLSWDNEGDNERRRLTMKLDILEEILKQFEIMRITDQVSNVKTTKL